MSHARDDRWLGPFFVGMIRLHIRTNATVERLTAAAAPVAPDLSCVETRFANLHIDRYVAIVEAVIARSHVTLADLGITEDEIATWHAIMLRPIAA